MNFTRLNWDDCTYKHNLKQSVGSSDYLLNTPLSDCRSCFVTDPSMRTAATPGVVGSTSGPSVCANKPLIDVDSELRIMNRKASNCPTDQYLPSANGFCGLRNFQDCQTAIPKEDTRISNPTCTLRCSGWNRWEWLCKNPQENALVPFDFGINNRLIVKDNHRPIVHDPINQASCLPPLNMSDDMVQYDPTSCMQPNQDIPSTTWRTCKTYAGYANA
jgi:hypothetical protein